MASVQRRALICRAPSSNRSSSSPGVRLTSRVAVLAASSHRRSPTSAASSSRSAAGWSGSLRSAARAASSRRRSACSTGSAAHRTVACAAGAVAAGTVDAATTWARVASPGTAVGTCCSAARASIPGSGSGEGAGRRSSGGAGRVSGGATPASAGPNSRPLKTNHAVTPTIIAHTAMNAANSFTDTTLGYATCSASITLVREACRAGSTPATMHKPTVRATATPT